MNRRKVNAVLAAIALLGAGAGTGGVPAEEVPGGEVTTADPPASTEDSATVWDKTKDVSGAAWEASKEGSVRAWDKTKEVSADAWEATKEGSARAWDKTKEVSADAWEAVKEGTASAWDEDSDMVQGEPQTGPGSAADASQESRVKPDPSP